MHAEIIREGEREEGRREEGDFSGEKREAARARSITAKHFSALSDTRASVGMPPASGIPFEAKKKNGNINRPNGERMTRRDTYISAPGPEREMFSRPKE